MVTGGGMRRRRDGIEVDRYDAALPTQVYRHRRIAAVVHALAQAVPGLSRRRAVAVLDSAVHQGKITRAEVEVAHDLAWRQGQVLPEAERGGKAERMATWKIRGGASWSGARVARR